VVWVLVLVVALVCTALPPMTGLRAFSWLFMTLPLTLPNRLPLPLPTCPKMVLFALAFPLLIPSRCCRCYRRMPLVPRQVRLTHGSAGDSTCGDGFPQLCTHFLSPFLLFCFDFLVLTSI
jgi:hypothetical protein